LFEFLRSSEVLLNAAKSGDWDKVTTLITQKAEIESRDLLGNSALNWAIRHGKYEVVDFLVNHRANLEAMNRRGHTILMDAAYFEKKDGKIVDFLIKNNANIEHKVGDIPDYFLFNWAIDMGFLSFAEKIFFLGVDTKKFYKYNRNPDKNHWFLKINEKYQLKIENDKCSFNALMNYVDFLPNNESTSFLFLPAILSLTSGSSTAQNL
jgi:hypothetical protein